ncbi:MAG: PAS domain-containing sensor histidine kinase [Myxococcota bacterium]
MVFPCRELLAQLRLPSATVGQDHRVRWVSTELDSLWPRHPFVLGQPIQDLGPEFFELSEAIQRCFEDGDPRELLLEQHGIRLARMPTENAVVILVQTASGELRWVLEALESAPFGVMVSNLDDQPLATNLWVQRLLESSGIRVPQSLGRSLGGSRETAMLLRGDDGSRLECVGQGEARRWLRIRSWLLKSRSDGEPTAVARLLADETMDVQKARQKEHLGALARLGEMAAVVAHEVKNPLAGVTGALRILSDRFSGDSAEHRIIKEMMERLRSLDNTIDELVLFARPIHPRPERAQLMDVLRLSASDVLQKPELQDVRIDIQGPALTITGDAELLRHCFRNIMNNGAQAMHGGGEIQVRVFARDSEVEVEVSDDGPGVPLQMEQKVFEPFFTTRNRGTGLGLPVAQRIAQSHGGNVEYRPHPGRGATFVVSLNAQVMPDEEPSFR